MKKKGTIRVLWLLNHTTLRAFELDQLARLGITEVFTPKSLPSDETDLSTSIDFSRDATLSIPETDLEILNAQNWYENSSEEVWRIANEYFDVAFMGFFPKQIESASRFFSGAIVLRACSLVNSSNYTNLLYEHLGVKGVERIAGMGKRFWFGAGFRHLTESEGNLLQERNCYLPVGLCSGDIEEQWTGRDKRILFVCPRISISAYSKTLYEKFLQDFSDFDYTIGGVQPISVPDPNVMGFVNRELYDENMRKHCVMFYPSYEINRIHYHPFEAIRAGMPLIFMAGGMLDCLGGRGLPGWCRTIKEARRKITRIFAGDERLINSIRESQRCLLELMKPENCAVDYKQSFTRILDELVVSRQNVPVKIKKRIAVILPVAYSGGSVRGAKLLAEALWFGSQLSGEAVDIIFGHLNDAEIYPDSVFQDLPQTITRRSFTWKTLDVETAYCAMSYAGHGDWEPKEKFYSIPDDGINQFLDCDLWVIVSDRLMKPLLPIRPYVLMVYDYIQRYVSFLYGFDNSFINAARQARKVLVTTHFTAQDAKQYVGVAPENLHKLPFLVPQFSHLGNEIAVSEEKGLYFIWTTNRSIHKNHVNAFQALCLYYDKFGGKLSCHITGYMTQSLLDNNFNHLRPLQDIYDQSATLKHKVKLCGELSEVSYQQKLKNAAFLWHAASIDNGTFSVIEAAQLGVPSLSNDYPPMREIDDYFKLNLGWMDGENPLQMAAQLKWMEDNFNKLSQALLRNTTINVPNNKSVAIDYWKVIQECL